MGMIGEITLINQNIHVPSVLASEYVGKEVLSKEIQQIMNEKKELKVNEVKKVGEISKFSNDKKRFDLKV